MSATELRGWSLGLAAAALAGALCSMARVPIPWMLGPLVTMGALRVAGVAISAPPGSRGVGQWIIGTALGLYFTPVVLHQVARMWPLLAAGAVFALAQGYGIGLVLARLAGIDRTTGVFASVPGGAAEMVGLGERFGAGIDRVAAAQSLRLLIVVVAVPSIFVALDLHGAEPVVGGARGVVPGGLALLLACTGIGGLAFSWLRLPNPFVLGGLAVAIPLTGSEIDLSAVPVALSSAAQLLLGCALGEKFQPGFLAGGRRFMASVVVATVLSMSAAAGFGWALAEVASLPAATVILGLAPGGIAEMCITAKILQLGVPMVTAFQVTRLISVLLFTGPMFILARRWRHRRRR